MHARLPAWTPLSAPSPRAMWQQQQKRPQTASSGPRRPAPLVCLGSRWRRGGPRSLSLISVIWIMRLDVLRQATRSTLLGGLPGCCEEAVSRSACGRLGALAAAAGWIRRCLRRLESPRDSRIDGGAGWWEGRVAEKGREFWMILWPGKMSGKTLLDTSQADCLLARYPGR
ncbi:uncharacterized protein J3D65DRAFT_638719 [Phyllosticta citribraziliensis]|uniref:Uncharacterized protein n=1 Tax=Phyllosticta citribraziliensis TaxID=989973 RepID=A0ABR1L939_9PEZI